MSNLVVKHNDFIEGRFHLELNQVKIIAKLSSLIQKDDEDFKLYTFQAKNLLEELKLGVNNYDDLKKSIDGLVDKTIELGKTSSTLRISLLSSAEYFKDGQIELEFSPKLKPYFLQLKENFTKYQLENVLCLNSFYAIRIYELLKQYEKLKERTFELENLKRILGISNKYKLYGHLKQKVLLIAEREINEKTDLLISFEEIKTSRKITSIKFLIEKKEKQVKQEENFKTTKEKEYSEEVESLFCMIKKIEQVESLKDLIKTSLKNYDYEYIKSNILYTNKNSKTNYTVYLKNALKNDYSLEERTKQIKKLENKQKIQSENEKIKQDEVEKEEQNKQEIKELIEYFTEQEKEKHYNEYLNDKYTLKEVVSFENYLIVKIDYDKILKLELQKRKIK